MPVDSCLQLGGGQTQVQGDDMKHRRIYLAIAAAIDDFGKRNHLKGREHIANAISIANGPNAHRILSAYLNTTSYNPVNPKRLTIDQVVDITYELDDEGALIVLDAIAQEFGYHISKNKPCCEKEVGINPVIENFMKISEKHGSMAAQIREAVGDGEIDDGERVRIIKEITKYRSKLQALEEVLS